MSIVLSAVLLLAATPSEGGLLDQASQALSEFRPQDALVLLERAQQAGPYQHADHVRLYEQMGIAHAYLDRPDEAMRAFRVMLALDPFRAISYTLSPKVTFLFERARKASEERPRTRLDVAWARDLTVVDPIAIDVEVLGDPEAVLSRARLYARLRGEPDYPSVPVELPPQGEHRRVELKPLAEDAQADQVVELYLVAHDKNKNEVLLWGSSSRPREIDLRYDPPPPWYGRWWVWALAGTAVAAGAGAAVYAATRTPDQNVPGTFEVLP